MKHLEGTFAGDGGLRIYYQSWCPERQQEGEVQAILAIVHGLGAHSGLFQTAVEALVPLGYAVYALDLRGHGRSPGRRGHINSWAEFRQDLHGFLQQIQRQASNCACFLWGHSLGGVIALDYALRFGEELQGLILTAPALGKVRISPVKMALGRSLSSVWPSFTLKVGNPEEMPLAVNQPTTQLRHGYGSARLATEFLATARWVQRHGADLRVPLLIMHGRDDQIAPAAGSLAFFQQVTWPDKERYEYPGDYHDLQLDANYQMMLRDLQHWLERHLKQQAACEIHFPVERLQGLERHVS